MIWSKRSWLAISCQPLAISFFLRFFQRRAISYQLIASSLLLLSSCGVYSFNGTNIDPSVRTISVQTIQNNAPTGPAFLTQRFTEDLKDYFQRNTNLQLVQRDGDLQFEGAIIAYDYAPAAIQKVAGVDQAGTNRLTIQTKIRFTNTKDDKQSFEQVFQSFDDYPATRDIGSINNDQTTVRITTSKIITDIFNKSVANW